MQSLNVFEQRRILKKSKLENLFDELEKTFNKLELLEKKYFSIAKADKEAIPIF